MSSYKADALVIRSREYNEADRLVTLYTREKGKVSAVAKGVRKPKSKQRGGTQLFMYADFLLYAGRTLDTIRQAQPRETFLYLWDDYERTITASAMMELLDAATVQGEADEAVFFLSLKFLFLLRELNPAIGLTAYALRLMRHQGYLAANDALDGKPLSPGSTAVLRQLRRLPPEQLDRLRLSAEQKKETAEALHFFCENKLERRLKAWQQWIGDQGGSV